MTQQRRTVTVRTSWLVDSNRIATKIKSASGANNPESVKWKSNPTRACPNCLYTIDNSDVAQQWPGLPRGVKFDPSDQEIIWHLLAKSGLECLKLHPFIDEFIPTVDQEDGICYTHPQNLPGVKQDGSVSHFFHRAIKAYNTGTRKRRKILGDDFGDVRWHKTGRTKPVILDGVQKGCKKIMVLYTSITRGGKSEKTNWVMHQYHLGTEEDERDGEYVISKIFCQQQQVKPGEKNENDPLESGDPASVKVDPVTPKSVTPDPPRPDKRSLEFVSGQDPCEADVSVQHATKMQSVDNEIQCEILNSETHEPCVGENAVDPMTDDNNQQADEEAKWWDNESQYLLDSQQLVEGLSLCDELLQSQSPNRDGNDAEKREALKDNKPRLSDYVQLGSENLKKDLEECQNLTFDPANLELDTPPDFRLSQLEFGSQDSFISWGGKVGD
ncbi:hypothetical protein CDL15_Pgr009446 [Punica granatum]|uniref:NAC domain-containing protein n=1 Tax=Punica granatum TaxID=22663 RepID=A0A218WUZ9_PUNGR|nr:hypothetical protein CDL15_Pgr009446 [Punica granatum]